MGAGDLARDIEAQTEALLAGLRGGTEKRLEQLLLHRLRNGIACCSKPTFRNGPRRSKPGRGRVRPAPRASVHWRGDSTAIARPARGRRAPGSVRRNSASMTRSGFVLRNSATTCSRTSASGPPASRSSASPSPRRPRAKSRTLSINPVIRRTLPRMRETISFALSFSGVCNNSRVPASIEASGLLRSWPSTAMNCSRSSALSRSAVRLASLVASRRCASR